MVIIMPEKKEEENSRPISINITKSLHQPLKKIKEKTRINMSEMIRECLFHPINIKGIAKRERVEIILDLPDGDGWKNASVYLSGVTIQKLEEIKSFHPGFSRSTIISLCLLKKSVTVDSLLQDIEDLYRPHCKVGGPIPSHILKSIRERK